jgi:hypothetical protein
MAEARETVEAEADSGAKASAAESKVLGAEDVSGEVLDTAVSTSVSAPTGAATSTTKVQQQQQSQPQLQHLPR